MLRYRGPDGGGLWIDGPVGLGHGRLSIVDVAGGHQPMSNEDGQCGFTYNGEIYNHAALRPRLEAKGHCYQTRSATETILHLYEEGCQRPPQHPYRPAAQSQACQKPCRRASLPYTSL